MNFNAATIATLRSTERAMALDLLDAEPITRLTEDEGDVEFLNELDQWDPEAEAMEAEWMQTEAMLRMWH